MSKRSRKAKTVTMVVLAPFTHNGEDMEEGRELPVPEALVDWLKERNLAKIKEPNAAPDAEEPN